MSSVETVTVAPSNINTTTTTTTSTSHSVSITPPLVSNASTASTTITSTPNNNNNNSNSHHNNSANNSNNHQQHVSLNSAEIATTPAIDTSGGNASTSTSTPKMNGLTLSELCCLFCCPPCPGRIAAKLAFLPPEPTYSVSADPNNQSKFMLKLSERADWQYNQRELDAFEVFYATSSRGNRIACMHIRATANPKFTILFSHGNAVDLGQMSSFYLGLGTRINCNIFSYDYSGYGASTGKPSEKNLYADINTAWTSMRTKFGISPDKIILYGQSIGTVPTVDLASRYEVGAVILHSPLMSGLRVAFPNTKRSWFFDAFPSIDKIPKINSPVLVIHGTEDEVIDFSHGVAIYERCPKALEPLWVQGASHNDVELYCQYLDRLKHLITVDLAPTSS